MKLLYALSLSLMLFSCVNKNTHQGVTMHDTNLSLDMLGGKFSNKGESPGGYKTPLLSEFLFPEFENDKLIDYITVTVNGDIVTVQGLDSTEELIQRSYHAGKDFVLENSAIQLESYINCGDCQKAGALHLGVVHNDRTLLFTEMGDIVLRKSQKGAIVVLFIIPVVGIDEIDFLYKKITNKPIKRD